MNIEEEVRIKGIESIFNKIIIENFLNLEKEMLPRYRKLVGHQMHKIKDLL
jgi:hypothetical protein